MEILWEKVAEICVVASGNNIGDRWRASSSVDKDVTDLRLALEPARHLIERSECWRLPLDGPIDKLLPKLKEAVYEAEIVVDEFAYQGSKNVVKKFSSGTSFLRKLMNNFPSAVKKALNELDKISKEMEKTCDNCNIPNEPTKLSVRARPHTTTDPSTTDGSSLESMCGREKELSEILNRMGVPESDQMSRSRNMHVGESSDGTNHEGKFSVLSIVGIGGVGKTTLAQMVCKDKRVESYFDLIMWVCVSDNFDLIKLTKEIIQSATNKDCDHTNLNSLQNNLKQALKSKRFLLVLDDVWSKDWQRLLGPMRGAREGSIVLVTTRSSKWVDLSRTDIASKGNVDLEGLEKNIFWEFFKSQAFGHVATSKVDPQLEDIGKEICERLKGSPLAANTTGRLLSMRMDATHWMQIKQSAMWQLRQEESDILPVLQLSYQYLPSHLKKCFSYCALYPKDFEFTKWELTKLWIMQGFIKLPEKIEVNCREPYIKEATENFHELVQRCFLQKTYIKEGTENFHSGKYVIHDLMHDVCQSLTKDECFCLENGDLVESINNRNVRHLSIFQKMNVKELESLCKYKKLFSVSLHLESEVFSSVIDKWCRTLTNIRSLSLPICDIKELPESIGNLKHLRYLDISRAEIESLPESFCELYNLVYLDMEGCSAIKSVPKGFSRLVNLCFLKWPAERLILIGHMENFVRDIEMTNMKLRIGHEGKIENLKHMNKVGGVLEVFNVENIPNKKAAEEAQLKKKPLINQLNLYWSSNREPVVAASHDEGVLEGLWPHPNLKALQIYDYGGRTLPNWFQKVFLSCLTRICIVGCKQLTNLQDCLNPDQFPMLQSIIIIDCENLVSLPVKSFGGFASLRVLRIRKCPKLIICSNVTMLPPSIQFVLMGKMLPPSIKELELEWCGGLENLIPGCLRNLTSLETLTIVACPSLVSIPAEATNNLKSLRSLSISECAELQSLGLGGCDRLTNLQDCLNPNQFPMLRRIEISDCENLVSLPVESFGGFASLTKLIISNCPKLITSSNAMVLPPSIHFLWLQSCGRLEKLIPSCLRNLTSLEVLSIKRCPDLVSIPPEATSNLKSSIMWLEIYDCPELQSLGGLKFINYDICGCPKLVETRGQNVKGKMRPELLSKLPSTASGSKRKRK